MLRTIAFALAALFTVAAQAQPLDGRLKRIAETKSIAIAYRSDATPFSFTDDKKQITGFSIDICKRVVNAIALQLNIPSLEIKWVPVTAGNRFDAVTKGQADMECGASTVSLSRMKEVDFSSYIFVESTGLVVKEASGIQKLADMAGKKIAVIAGTTNERAVNAQLKRRLITAEVTAYRSGDEALAALVAGKADAFAWDKLLLVGAAARAKSTTQLVLLAEDLSFEPYGIVLPRGDSAFRLAVNTGISRLYMGAEINEIFGYWFAALGAPSPLLEAVYTFGAIPE